MHNTGFMEFTRGLKYKTCCAIESWCGRIEYAKKNDRLREFGDSNNFDYCGCGTGIKERYVPYRRGAIHIGNGSYKYVSQIFLDDGD